MRRCRAFHLGTKSCVALRSGISLSAVPMLNGWWLAANAFILIVFGTSLRVIRRKSTKEPESITLRFMRNRVPCIPLLPSSSQFPRMLKITKFNDDQANYAGARDWRRKIVWCKRGHHHAQRGRQCDRSHDCKFRPLADGGTTYRYNCCRA